MSHLPSDHERLTPWPDLSALKRDPNPQPLTPGQQAILDAVPFDIFQSWPKRPNPDPVEVVLEQMAGAPSKRYDANCRQVDATTSTVSTAPPATLTLAAMEKLLADIPPEPLGEWMREQGFPPEASLLILPETMRSQLPFWPSYVRISVDVSAPTLMRDVLAGHQVWERYRK